MPIEVEGPDGKVHTFPDGTPDDAIKSNMRTTYSGWRASPPMQAGRPTALNSPIASPQMQSAPDYITNDDWDQIALTAALGEKNRGVVQAIQNTPGHAFRLEMAKKAGQRTGELEDKQRAAERQLEMLHLIRKSANALPPEDYKASLGAANIQELAPKRPLSVFGVPLPTTIFGEYPTTLDPKTGVPINEPLTRVQREFILNENDPKARKAWDIQNTMEHDVHALVSNFIASAGATAGGSDARVAKFEHAIRDMLKASDHESFNKIAAHAEELIARNGNISLDQLDAVRNRIGAEAARRGGAGETPATPSQPGPAQPQRRTDINSGSVPGFAEAAQELMRNSSKRRREQFDEVFGPGQADIAIRMGFGLPLRAN